MKKEWKWIKGYEGIYKIYTNGDIVSVKRTIERYMSGTSSKMYRAKDIKLKFGMNSKGYYAVNLCKYHSVKRFLVHRLVAETFIENNGHKVVDHINRDITDNNVSNLRWCTQQENMLNKKHQKKRYDNKSGHTGVTWGANINKWRVWLWDRNLKKNIYIGNFKSKKLAAIAYNKKAVELWGDDAYQNQA